MAHGVTSTEYALALVIMLTATMFSAQSLGLDTKESLYRATITLSLSNPGLHVDDEYFQGGSSEGTGVVDSGDCTFAGEFTGCQDAVWSPIE